jgi:outer membrane lipoprotein SlyB
MKRFIRSLAAAVVAIAVVACSTPGPTAGEVEIRQGVIEQISAVTIDSNHQQGVGAVVGGLAGLGIGSLIGGGTGRDVAMVLGAVGGAVAGNEVQKKNDKPVPGQQVIVRSGNGVLVSITQPVNPNLKVGQKVYIQGSGDAARVVAQ